MRFRPLIALNSSDVPIGVPGHPDADDTVGVYPGHGNLHLVYVANNSGADILQGAIVKPTSTSAHNFLVSAAAADASNLVIGAAFTKIPDGKTGWVVTRGKCKVLAAGNIAAAKTLIPAASARVTEAAAITGASIGVIAQDASAASAGDQVLAVLKLQ